MMFEYGERVRIYRDDRRLGTVIEPGAEHALVQFDGDSAPSPCWNVHLSRVCDVDVDIIGPYEDLGAEIGKLVDAKQAQYGDSFSRSGEILAILYPNGVKPSDYTELLGVVRVLDKLFRIATNNDPTGEPAWGDVAGYALLGLKRSRDR